MELFSDWKSAAAVGAVVIGLGSFIPYLVDIFRGKNKPHAYTWLIWSITQATATAGVIAGGGGLVAWNLAIGAAACFLVFLLCFKYGTRNIRPVDGVVLFLALAAVVVWWQLENPVLAVLMVSAIDGLGYLPTYRKLWQEPWTENISSWLWFVASAVLSLLALHEYNLLTVPYITLTLAANALLIAIAFLRRPLVPKPS
jgi:hypothetical protein